MNSNYVLARNVCVQCVWFALHIDGWGADGEEYGPPMERAVRVRRPQRNAEFNIELGQGEEERQEGNDRKIAETYIYVKTSINISMFNQYNKSNILIMYVSE